MIQLELTRPHWILDDGDDDPDDLCVHSPVTLTVNGIELVSPIDGDWAVSTSALYLLRSLFADRALGVSQNDQLFPHCGHVFLVDPAGKVGFLGCSTGIDIGVTREGDDVRIASSMGAHGSVPVSEWREAVVRFVDQVRAFYAHAAAKIAVHTEDEQAFHIYQRELAELWRRA